mmetsp:Transcript_76600/g.228255  ORF Transcript_76600/g.228255 Transcript_76600/m.228255 type:complete len:225 (+) Transcript_76600:100-774(+)
MGIGCQGSWGSPSATGRRAFNSAHWPTAPDPQPRRTSTRGLKRRTPTRAALLTSSEHSPLALRSSSANVLFATRLDSTCETPTSVMPTFRNWTASKALDNRTSDETEVMPMSPTSLPSSARRVTCSPCARCSSSSNTFVSITRPVAWRPQLERSRCRMVFKLWLSNCEKRKYHGMLALRCSKSPRSSSIEARRASAASMPAKASLRICADFAKSFSLEESDFFF